MNADTHDKTEHQRILAHAFDSTWERFIALEGRTFDTNRYRRSLANKIVGLSRTGVVDVNDLSEAALLHLRVLAEAGRLAARTHSDHDMRTMGRTHDAPDLVPRSLLSPGSLIGRRHTRQDR